MLSFKEFFLITIKPNIMFLKISSSSAIFLSFLSSLASAHTPCSPTCLPDSGRVNSLGEVTVVANRHAEQKKNLPQSVSLIDSARIAHVSPQTSADLLANEGILAVQKSQQGGGSPSIRGFESSRVLLMVDGVRLNNLIYRSGHLQNILSVDPASVRKVEVLSGPASVAYGSDAMGGVIAFQTLKPNLKNKKGMAFIRTSSANGEASGHLEYNIGGKHLAALFSASFCHFGDLRSGKNRNPFLPSGDDYISRPFTSFRQNGQDILVPVEKEWQQPGSAYSQLDLIGKLLYVPRQGQNHTLNLQMSTTTDLPRYDRLTDLKGSKPKFAEWYYGPQERSLASYSFSGRNLLGADQLEAVLAYQGLKESRHNRKLNDPWLGSRKEKVDVLSLNTDWTRSFDPHQWHLGVDASLQFLKSTAFRTNIDNGNEKPLDTRYPGGKNLMNNIDLFASYRFAASESFSFLSGARIGYSHLSATFTDHEFFPLFAEKFGTVVQNNPTYSLSAGLVWRPDVRSKYGASLSSGHRVPNIDDLGKVFDSQPGLVVVPNPRIRPEQTVSLDLNTTQLLGDWLEFETSAFGTYIFDAITLAPTLVDGKSEILYDGEPSRIFANHNARRAYVAGLSGRLQAAINENWHLNANANYTYGNILESKESGEQKMALDHVPPIFGRVGVSYTPPLRKMDFELFALFNGPKPLSRYNLNGEDNIGYATRLGADGKGLPAWATINLRWEWQPSPRLSLQAGCDNILDLRYRTFASGINAPGRNLNATIRWRF